MSPGLSRCPRRVSPTRSRRANLDWRGNHGAPPKWTRKQQRMSVSSSPPSVNRENQMSSLYVFIYSFSKRLLFWKSNKEEINTGRKPEKAGRLFHRSSKKSSGPDRSNAVNTLASRKIDLQGKPTLEELHTLQHRMQHIIHHVSSSSNQMCYFLGFGMC